MSSPRRPSGRRRRDRPPRGSRVSRRASAASRRWTDVSFDVAAGSVVGLIGPNGAGKTTTFNLITGNHRLDAGSVRFEGRPLAGLRPHRIVSLGIARTFQNIRLFQQLSAVENVLAGRHCRTRAGLLGGHAAAAVAGARGARGGGAGRRTSWPSSGLAGRALELARNLSHGDQRRLEIARALATDPRLLVLDEPAGGMNEQETDELVGLIGRHPRPRHHRPPHRARHEPGDARLRAHRRAGVRRARSPRGRPPRSSATRR